MTEKKIGLLNKQNNLERKQGNIIPKQSFTDSNTKQELKRKEFKNQKGSIKVPLSTKKEINALKDITKTKTDYEMIQTLIDFYTAELDTSKQKRFRLLIEE